MRIRSLQFVASGVMLVFGFTVIAFAQDRSVTTADQKQEAMIRDLKLSGAYTHENLTIFLISGEDRIKGKNFLTLQEAIEQKKMIVHETENVNGLAVENVSSDQEIFFSRAIWSKAGSRTDCWLLT